MCCRVGHLAPCINTESRTPHRNCRRLDRRYRRTIDCHPSALQDVPIEEATVGLQAEPGQRHPSLWRRQNYSWRRFMPAQQARFSRYVMSSPVKSCTLDPVPAFLVREFTYLLLPYLTVMVKPVCWHLRNMPLCHRWSRNLVLTGLMRPTTGPFQITHLKGR